MAAAVPRGRWSGRRERESQVKSLLLFRPKRSNFSRCLIPPPRLPRLQGAQLIRPEMNPHPRNLAAESLSQPPRLGTIARRDFRVNNRGEGEREGG